MSPSGFSSGGTSSIGSGGCLGDDRRRAGAASVGSAYASWTGPRACTSTPSRRRRPRPPPRRAATGRRRRCRPAGPNGISWRTSPHVVGPPATRGGPLRGDDAILAPAGEKAEGQGGPIDVEAGNGPRGPAGGRTATGTTATATIPRTAPATAATRTATATTATTAAAASPCSSASGDEARDRADGVVGPLRPFRTPPHTTTPPFASPRSFASVKPSGGGSRHESSVPVR